MTSNLAPYLPDGSGAGGVRLWLKSSGYARRLLAGAEGDPWQTPAAYLAFFAQAHGLLRPDVAVIEVADLYRSWTRRHPDLVADMGARRRVVVPLREMLDADGPRGVLNEVVEAVVAHMRGRGPVVLAFPGPRAWLEEAKAIAGLADLAVDDDAVEDAAMYVADLLRAVSRHPIAGVLLEEDGTRDLDASGLAALRPILNVAEHYRWGVVLRGRFAAGLDPASFADFDAVIAERPFEAPLAGAFGRDVGDAPWRGAPVPEVSGRSFRFVEIPIEARPETVLDSLDRLR